MNPIVNFKVQPFIDAAEELLRADETLRALHLLDNLPGYYRENIPVEVHNLRREIMSRIATSSFYAGASDYELSAGEETHKLVHNTLRGKLLLQDMKYLNQNKDLMPHLLDFAPGEYAFVRMLQLNGCLFTYEASYVNQPSYQKYKPHFEEIEGKWCDYSMSQDAGERPRIFFAGEILEHLYEERELRFEMERTVGLADILHISTPNMTFDFSCVDWRVKGDLGHLRTYTPTEFFMVIAKMFPEYHVQILVSPILHARCVKKTTAFDIPKEVTP